MALFAWQRNFVDMVRGKDAVICYGNVRDRFAYASASGIRLCGLEQLLAFLLEDVLGDLYVYDPALRLRHYQVQADSVIDSPVKEEIHGLAPAQEDSFEYRPEADAMYLMVFAGRPLDEPRAGAPPPVRCLVLSHAAPLMAERTGRGDDDERRVFFMRRMIDSLAPGRKLIMVYLMQEQIPRDFYVNAPRVGLFEVPLPSPEERRAISAKYSLDDQLISFYANLTEGLSATETMRILEQLPYFMGMREAKEPEAADIERAIKRFKFGERPDPYESLSIAKLEKASAFFKDGMVVDDRGRQIGAIPGVRGQDEAVEAAEKMLWRAKTNVGQLLRDPGSLPPRGVIFFCGPSGTGKTMLAKRIALYLFDSEEAFTRFDMSEYMHDFAVSRLLGAPPGYVGAERGGQLTNAVRSKPFSVVLFDEVEKAHPRVLDIFLQILSNGRLTDSLGRVVFFSETIVVFTSNIGMRSRKTAGMDVAGAVGATCRCEEMENYRDLLKQNAGWDRVRKHFVDSVTDFYEREISRPELLSRLGNNIVPFKAVTSKDIVEGMFDSYLKKIQKRFGEVYAVRGLELDVREDVKSHFARNFKDQAARFGGRAVVNALEDVFLTELARALLRMRETDSHRRLEARIVQGNVRIG